MARKFGVLQNTQSQPINLFSLQGDPGIQGLKGEKVRETPDPGRCALATGSLSDPFSSFPRGSPACPAAQLWGPSILGLLQGPKEMWASLASVCLGFR